MKVKKEEITRLEELLEDLGDLTETGYITPSKEKEIRCHLVRKLNNIKSEFAFNVD